MLRHLLVNRMRDEKETELFAEVFRALLNALATDPGEELANWRQPRFIHGLEEAQDIRQSRDVRTLMVRTKRRLSDHICHLVTI